MATNLEEGRIYRFINLRKDIDEVLEMDPDHKIATVGHFTGDRLQQWEFRTINGLWTFKNVETGLYLGLDSRSTAKNGVAVVGTNVEFGWAGKESSKGPKGCSFHLYVPYTTYVLDSDHHNKMTVIIWTVNGSTNSHDGLNQIWKLDTNISPPRPCIAGKTYKITSSAGTVAHLETPKKTVAGYLYNEGRNQLWEAVPHSSSKDLWAFKNVAAGTFLSIDCPEVGKDVKDARVIAKPTAFYWHLIFATTQKGYRFVIPNTDMSIDLHNGEKHPGTLIHIWTRTDKTWILEQVGDAKRPFGDYCPNNCPHQPGPPI